MRTVAQFSIEKPIYTWILVLVCFFGGLFGIDSIGRLEDPAFPIKNALVITTYAGASAEEVEQEVTDVIEAALQELPYLEELTSKSVSGRSEVMVRLKEEYGDDETPQIFDELRRRVIEAASRLYYDPTTKSFKRGSASQKRRGNVRRFVNYLQQLELNYDLYSMPGTQLFEMLPEEYEVFRRSD